MNTLGNGTYGLVQIKNNEIVIKKISLVYYNIFLRELVILRYLNLSPHSNNYVVELIDYDVNKGILELRKCIRDLNKWIDIDKPDNIQRGIVIPTLIQSLLYLHINGIVHADIKPSNIMLIGNKVIFIDFGLSGTPEWALVNLTTPIYADPSNNTSFPSDIYCFGIILTELMVGETLTGSGKDIKDLVKKVDKTYRPLIKSMLVPQQHRRPIAIQIAYNFNVDIPLTIKPPDGEIFTGNIENYILDWISVIINDYEISGPHNIIYLASLGHTIGNSDMRQYYLVAILFLYASIYRGNVRMSMMVSLCPLNNSYIDRRNILSQKINELVRNDIIIYRLIKKY